MQVARWGEDLVVRLPEDLVSALALKEGDEVQVVVNRQVQSEPVMSREEASRVLDEAAVKLPPDWKFDREEAHERAWMWRFDEGEKH